MSDDIATTEPCPWCHQDEAGVRCLSLYLNPPDVWGIRILCKKCGEGTSVFEDSEQALEEWRHLSNASNRTPGLLWRLAQG